MRNKERILIFLMAVFAAITARADGEVIEIWTTADLAVLRNNVNAGTDNYQDKTVKLMNDLSLEGWTPIGTIDDDTYSFKGMFDGQGNTINITVTASSTVLGLFGYLRGTVQHLCVTGSVVNTEAAYTSSTAGIAAYNRGTITQCANKAIIVGTIAGGIAGENHGTITHCFNTGYIGGTSGSASYYLGGIAGAFDGTEISYVFAQCTIESVGTTGGIVANNQSGTLSNSYYNISLYSGDSYHQMDGSTNLTGDALATEGFNSDIWTFTAGEVPQLTCMVNSIPRIANNYDNSEFLTRTNGATDMKVQLHNRTLYKDGDWNTLCLPFSLTAEQIAASPLAGAIIKEFTSATLEGTELTLGFTETTAITAGTPYLIKWTSGADITEPVFRGVTIDNTLRPVSKDNENVQFIGTFSPVHISNDGTCLFLGTNNTLHYPGSNTYTMRTCRAFFLLSSSIKTAASRFTLAFDDETTSINEELRMKNEESAGAMFDLLGRRATAPKQGLYLMRGKKIIKK